MFNNEKMFSLSGFFSIFIFCFCTLGLIPENKKDWLYQFGLFSTFIIFFYSLGFFVVLDSSAGFQELLQFSFFQIYPIIFGIDSLSLFLILLTTSIFPFCLLTTTFGLIKNLKKFIFLFLSLEFLLIGVFTSLDFLIFYIFFEFSLVPMFLLIGWWGGQNRRMKAAYYFFLYTFFGSLFMLISLLILLFFKGNLNYFVLLQDPFNHDLQYYLWPGIFLGMAIKIPMVPFHIWLPEAHVEAPTSGSVILAGILLKLGGYGMIRYLLPLFPVATQFYAPLVLVLATVGAFYGAFTALRQIDLKRIVAYSSIAHMNAGLIGLFSLTAEGIDGFYYLMLGHGFISSALFFLVGILYDRYHTRIYYYYSGLTLRMPLTSFFFFFF